MATGKTVLSAFNKSVKIAIKEGRLDGKMHGGVIEAARKLAALMDQEDWPLIDGRFDNVTPSTYAKYCEMLRLTPDKVPGGDKKADDTSRLVGNSKWKKGIDDQRQRDTENIHASSSGADA